ncbi:MAG: glycosyltransferase, partial [Trebonia sp.]
MSQVAVVIPAYNEADLVRATVTAAAALPGVDVVVVVDDGSQDATADVARDAGGRVLRYARNHGKAMAMSVGALEVAAIDRRRPAEGPRHLLFLDADLGA